MLDITQITQINIPSEKMHKIKKRIEEIEEETLFLYIKRARDTKRLMEKINKGDKKAEKEFIKTLKMLELHEKTEALERFEFLENFVKNELIRDFQYLIAYIISLEMTNKTEKTDMFLIFDSGQVFWHYANFKKSILEYFDVNKEDWAKNLYQWFQKNGYFDPEIFEEKRFLALMKITKET